MLKLFQYLLLLFFCGCGLFRKETPIGFVSGSYPVRPGWTKKDVYEVVGTAGAEDFIYFTGISNYVKDKYEAKNQAIDSAVKFFLSYAGIKDDETLEAFRKDFTPRIITAVRNKEKGPYGVMESDFYLEKYIIKKTKRVCYKGYIQLKFPLPKWIELRSYIRATVESKFYKR